MGGSVHVHSFVSLLVSDSKISGVPHLYTPNTWRWRRQWHPTPVLLPGKSHGRRSLVGCSPWGCEESDTTERLHFDFSLSCIGGENGNPLQYSCLENPRDGGARWAAVYGVTQSRTRLKQLSSSKSLHECILSLAIPFSCVWIDVPLGRNLVYLVLGAVMSKEPPCSALQYEHKQLFQAVLQNRVISFNEAASLYIYVHIYTNLLIL